VGEPPCWDPGSGFFDKPQNRSAQRDRRQFALHHPNSLDGPLTLSSGERRILTAVTQYPQGRSKVQVAILSGYAPNGGGFNNYLGRLRTLELVQGRGELRESDNLFDSGTINQAK
jgi:hypothetical protein